MTEIKQLIPQGYCLRCRGCCRFAQETGPWVPHLLAEERKLPEFPAGTIHCRPQPGHDGFLCEFLIPETNGCRVYLSRPMECRLYPFVLRKSGSAVALAVDLNCPFVQESRETPAFKEYGAYLKSLFDEAYFKKIVKDNPQIIQDYDSAVDLFLL